jgi:hypothetical protein
MTTDKTTESKIEWHIEGSTPDQMVEYLAKAEHVANEILSQRFYKRPGKWCGYWDYLPVCTGNHKKAETLVQIG